MPVLIAATSMTSLMAGGPAGDPGRPSFLNAGTLRPRLERLKRTELRGRALEIADRLDERERQYAAAAAAAIDAFCAETAEGRWSEDALVGLMERRDRAFARMIDEVIVAREELRLLLQPFEWRWLFD